MEFLRFLHFLVLCTDFLAWPLFALIYPLLASIRAIESGSKYDMKKLVIYWTLLSLLSLFELVFVKIIEWIAISCVDDRIPFWSCIKLIVVCLLVVPRFNGACYAYESYVRSCFLPNLQAVTGRFLDVAEKYIKENGSETLERLVATQRECKKLDGFSNDVLVQLPDTMNASVTLDQLKYSDAVRKGIRMLEPTNKTASSEAKLVQLAQPSTGLRVEMKTDASFDVIKTTRVTERVTKRLESPLTRKIQRGWTCDLCLVTIAGDSNLQDHLQGKKHKTKCEELRTSKETAEGTGLIPLSKLICHVCNATMYGPTDLDAHLNGKKHLSNMEKMRNLIFHVCNVKLQGPASLDAHLKGKKHLSNMEKMVKL